MKLLKNYPQHPFLIPLLDISLSTTQIGGESELGRARQPDPRSILSPLPRAVASPSSHVDGDLRDDLPSTRHLVSLRRVESRPRHFSAALLQLLHSL